MRAASLALAAFASLHCPGQCLRPEPPAGGHPLHFDLVVSVTYTDGYETFGSMIYPATSPPACGWPLVVHVHPLGMHRGVNLQTQMMIAGQGYAVWSYDVRGQGQAIPANPTHPQSGSTIWGPLERHDLVEQIQFVAANPAWVGIVDASRVAVMGSSQGAAHAWAAAAFSGQPVSYPGRPTHVFPTIACVAPTDLVADPADDWLRAGRLWSSWFVEALSGSYSAMPFDPGFVQMCRDAFVAQDPGNLIAAWAAEGRLLSGQLATSSVPVYYAHAYHDIVDGPFSAMLRLESMQGPRRALLGTIGHGVAPNLAEGQLRSALAVRWFHRFLWNEPNEVDLELPYILPELPLLASERDDPNHLWSRAHVASTTTPPTAQRFWLHDDASMQATAPLAPQVDAILQQTIDPLTTTFTPYNYLHVPAVRDLPNVLAACPLSERVWSAVLPEEVQMTASSRLHLRLLPHQPSWMIAVLLTVQPPDPGADEVVIATHGIASSNSVAEVPETHEVRLPPIAVRIPAGSTLRLRLRNLWLRELPQAPSLEVAPLFHDFRVDIVHGDPEGSWIDVPLEPPALRLVADRTWLELAAPAPIVATLRGGTARAGAFYFTAVGMSGHLPGVPFLGTVLPIEADWLAATSAGSGDQPWFTGFFGLLDAAGQATSTFDLSSIVLPQAMNGWRFTFCAFAFDAAGGSASNPCDVMLR